jgi:poly(3-hydroxyalkanoate) synthetase
LFQYLRPYPLRTGKFLDLLRRPPDDDGLRLTLRMEHWLMNGPLLSLPALTEYRREVLEGPPLAPLLAELSARLPVQLLIAEADHIVPMDAALPTGIAETVQDLARFDTGHIGLLMGRAHPAVAGRMRQFAAQYTAAGPGGA